MDGSKTRSGKIYSIDNKTNQKPNQKPKTSLSVYYSLTINYIDDKVERMLPIKNKKSDICRTYNTRSKAKK